METVGAMTLSPEDAVAFDEAKNGVERVENLIVASSFKEAEGEARRILAELADMENMPEPKTEVRPSL